MKTHMYCYNSKSEGASLLAKELGIQKIRHENSKYRGGKDKRVINWGATKLPEEVLKSVILNRPENVRNCSDKLRFFTAISEQHADLVPDWTTDFDTALAWVADNSLVCARTVLNGHSAEGLVIMSKDNPNGFVRAPLYTKYVKKLDEYRVHVVNGRVIDIQKKALSNEKRDSGEDVNWQVRNHANGFIYMREGVNPPEVVKTHSVTAVEAMGLDFGAVDVIFNTKSGRAYVLEINTAPGLSGQTVTNYAEAFA